MSFRMMPSPKIVAVRILFKVEGLRELLRVLPSDGRLSICAVARVVGARISLPDGPVRNRLQSTTGGRATTLNHDALEAEPFTLFGPIRRQVVPEFLYGQIMRLTSIENRLDNVGRKECTFEDATHVALVKSGTTCR